MKASTKKAIEKYTEATCRKAHQLCDHDGLGACTISYDLNITDKNGNPSASAANAAINAGRELFEADMPDSCENCGDAYNREETDSDFCSDACHIANENAMECHGGKLEDEKPASYTTGSCPSQEEMEDEIIHDALRILEARVRAGDALSSSNAVKQWVAVKSAGYEHEVFSVLLFNNQHEVIDYVELFRGTIDGAAVYPREVAKLVLEHNAAAVIFTHNHPSGKAEPSQADIAITHKLDNVLKHIEVRVLDHLIVGGQNVVSFAERGLL